jgi:hypothetical protein
MPTLVWVAFWSCMMGAATCWQDAEQPVRVKANDRRDPAVKGTDRRDYPAL